MIPIFSVKGEDVVVLRQVVREEKVQMGYYATYVFEGLGDKVLFEVRVSDLKGSMALSNEFTYDEFVRQFPDHVVYMNGLNDIVGDKAVVHPVQPKKAASDASEEVQG